MRRFIVLIPFALCCTILAVSATVNAQSPKQPRQFKHKGDIVSEFDKFKNETTIRLKPYFIAPAKGLGDPRSGLSLIAGFTHEGEQLTDKLKQVSLGLRFHAEYKAFDQLDMPHLLAIIDGERVDLGEMKMVDVTVGASKGFLSSGNVMYTELAAVVVPKEMLKKLADAKAVEMQAGRRVEFKLKEGHLEALRDLASRMQQ